MLSIKSEAASHWRTGSDTQTDVSPERKHVHHFLCSPAVPSKPDGQMNLIKPDRSVFQELLLQQKQNSKKPLKSTARETSVLIIHADSFCWYIIIHFSLAHGFYSWKQDRKDLKWWHWIWLLREKARLLSSDWSLVCSGDWWLTLRQYPALSSRTSILAYQSLICN